MKSMKGWEEWTVKVYEVDEGECIENINFYQQEEKAKDEYCELVDVYGDSIEYDVFIFCDDDLIATTAYDDIDEDVTYYKNCGEIYAFA